MAKRCEDCIVGCEHTQWEGSSLLDQEEIHFLANFDLSRTYDDDRTGLTYAIDGRYHSPVFKDDFERFAFCPMCGRSLVGFWKEMEQIEASKR